MKRHLCIFGLFGALAAGAVETPTMGWSSWNAFRVNISEGTIRHAAKLLKELGLADVGYVYVNTDDGYFGGRDANGRLITHPKRFPNGLKGMVDYIHSLGLKAGIYSDGGENTCGSIWDNDECGKGVGLWNHDQQDADYFFKELDFDFIKIDFCGGLPNGNSAKVKMDEKERYTAIRQAVDRAKKGVRINICRWAYPGTWVGSVGSSWRISHDIGPNWKKVNDIIHQSLYLSAYSGPGAFNDMDMLEVGRGLTREEDKTHFGIWCMMNSPLLIGCDLQKTRYDPETMALLKNTELIALNQDLLCRQAYVVKRSGETYVLVRDLRQTEGCPTRAVAFLNTTDAEARMSVTLEELDLLGSVRVRDLFERKDLPDAQDSLVITVPPHGTRIFKLMAKGLRQRTKYEAETAWLATYQELHDPVKAGTAYYRQDPEASGGVVAAGVGGAPENYLEWRNVRCRSEGKYHVKIVLRDASAVEYDTILKAGDNVIRYGDKVRHDVDYMEIHGL
ncbi:MAG: glycoside hydrolase family 27 protein [Kiritimatiellia bacterium]